MPWSCESLCSSVWAFITSTLAIVTGIVLFCQNFLAPQSPRVSLVIYNNSGDHLHWFLLCLTPSVLCSPVTGPALLDCNVRDRTKCSNEKLSLLGKKKGRERWENWKKKEQQTREGRDWLSKHQWNDGTGSCHGAGPAEKWGLLYDLLPRRKWKYTPQGPTAPKQTYPSRAREIIQWYGSFVEFQTGKRFLGCWGLWWVWSGLKSLRKTKAKFPQFHIIRWKRVMLFTVLGHTLLFLTAHTAKTSSISHSHNRGHPTPLWLHCGYVWASKIASSCHTLFGVQPSPVRMAAVQMGSQAFMPTYFQVSTETGIKGVPHRWIPLLWKLMPSELNRDHWFIVLGSTKSYQAVTNFTHCQQRQDSNSICNYYHYRSWFCMGGVAGMLIWQPFLLACQLASSAADGRAAAPDPSVQDQAWSQQIPSSGTG